jgi:hypothetical protein
MPDVRVYVGDSGTGKSRAVYDEFGYDGVYSASLPGRVGGEAWFDDYAGERCVLLDDFTGKEYSFSFLLRLLDRYPLRVPVKGSFVNFNSEVIIITTNVNIEDWYPEVSAEQRRALRRRISSVRQFHALRA